MHRKKPFLFTENEKNKAGKILQIDHYRKRLSVNTQIAVFN